MRSAGPAERVMPWHEYRDRFLTEKRIHAGHGLLDRARRQRSSASAIPDVAATRRRHPRRRDFLRPHHRSLSRDRCARDARLRLSAARDFLPRRAAAVPAAVARGGRRSAKRRSARMPARWARRSSFPPSYRKYAIDGDGDGKRDLWTSWDDVIGWVANYLRAHGWREGEPVVVTATLDERRPEPLQHREAGAQRNRAVAARQGRALRDEPADDAPAMLIVAQGKDGPVYRVGFNNFYVITRYNRSPMYAMAVHDLGQADPELHARCEALMRARTRGAALQRRASAATLLAARCSSRGCASAADPPPAPLPHAADSPPPGDIAAIPDADPARRAALGEGQSAVLQRARQALFRAAKRRGLSRARRRVLVRPRLSRRNARRTASATTCTR